MGMCEFPRGSRRKQLVKIEAPADLDAVLDAAWEVARTVPGYLVENEARLLGTIAACVPADGAIVEIGSFKGKSTVMLAKVAEHYGLGPIVAIDPHNSPALLDLNADPNMSSFKDFLRNIETAGVAHLVEPYRAYSKDVAAIWDRSIRFLWIDGDHTYNGAKTDFDGFFRHVNPGGVVAFHDSLHEFAGPIRVFVEDVLRSDRFGAAGFVHSIAWSQFRPGDGARFSKQRAALERAAAPLIPLLADDDHPRRTEDKDLHGLKKLQYKLHRWRVPHKGITPGEWVARVNG